ncbi:MAG: hypothetical protein ABL878_19765, partial [Burkholderiales bacterium]
FTSELDRVLRVAGWEFLKAFREDDAAAWDNFTRTRAQAIGDVDALQLLSERALSDLESRLK